MPVAVMDNDSIRENTRDDNSGGGGSSGLKLARVFSAPDPTGPGLYRPGEPHPPSYKSPPSSHARQLSRGSYSPTTRGFPAGHVQLDSITERPEKRPRLEQKLDTSAWRASKVAAPLEKWSPSYKSLIGSGVLSTASPQSSDFSEHDQGQSPCFNCSDSENMLTSIIKSVLDLQLEIARAVPVAMPDGPHESVPHVVTKQGLKHSLLWTANELRGMVQAMQQASATTRPGLPPLAEVVPGGNLSEARRPDVSGQSAFLATPSSEVKQLPLLSELSRSEEDLRRHTEYTKDSYSAIQDASLPPILTPEGMKRAHTHERVSSGSAQSPHGSGGHGYVPQSPTQSQRSNRTLPSPPSSQYPSTGLMASSQFPSTTSQAAHASHLQDLQHQISTKTLALQTLQREHDQLLAAFSRSQIRCNTLDKKSRVSDHEINTLTEEKIRLQQQLDSLEAHVEDLAKSRDEVYKQSSADGAQWRQIMAMSSQLQIKGSEEARRYKADRDAWEDDRAALRQRVRELEASHVGSKGKEPDAGIDEDPLNATSMEAMRQEIVTLRQRCADLEQLLQDLSGETEQIDKAINAMTSIRQRIANQKKKDDTG